MAGWFTVDDLRTYPALVPWVNLDLDFASIAAATGSATVHLPDNDPFTADWPANAGRWLATVAGSVHLTHGAGHLVTTSADPVIDTIRAAALDAGQHGPDP